VEARLNFQPDYFTAEPAKIAESRQLSSSRKSVRTELFMSARPGISPQPFWIKRVPLRARRALRLNCTSRVQSGFLGALLGCRTRLRGLPTSPGQSPKRTRACHGEPASQLRVCHHSGTPPGDSLGKLLLAEGSGGKTITGGRNSSDGLLGGMVYGLRQRPKRIDARHRMVACIRCGQRCRLSRNGRVHSRTIQDATKATTLRGRHGCPIQGVESARDG